MMHTRAWASVVLAVLAWHAGPPGRAGELTMELDCAANPRLLGTHFATYGHSPAKTVKHDARGTLHLRLPAAKDVAQTGVYSYVKLAGDFEVSASYEWVSVTPPTKGYGASCGLAIDTGDRGIMVALARAHFAEKGKGPGYALTRGVHTGAEVKYDTTCYFSTANRGRLVLRRDRGELICLTADGPNGSLEERERLPLAGAIGQVRFFADTGGSPTALHARLSQLRIRAEEITGGFPSQDQPRHIPWWAVAAGALLVVTLVLVLIRQRLQQRWPWADPNE